MSISFEDVLRELQIPYAKEGHHHCRPGWLQLNCPYCGSRNFHLGYNIAYGYMNCYRCGPHGVANAVALLAGVSYQKTKALLTDVSLSKLRREDKPRGTLKLPKIGPLLPAHTRYLKKRGFDPDEIVRLWGVQGIGIAAKLSWRLFIPFHSHGRIVTYTTRAVTDNVAKRYITAELAHEAIPAKELLYGEDYCRHACIVHEGALDVWRTGPGAVATCGMDYSRAQVTRLAKYSIRIFCYDNEREAQRRARRLADELTAFPGETVIAKLDSKDAGSATPRETRRLRAMLKG